MPVAVLSSPPSKQLIAYDTNSLQKLAMIPSGATLIAPKRPPRPPSTGEVASFQAAKVFLDGCITNIEAIDEVSTALMDQLLVEKEHIVQEVRCNKVVPSDPLFCPILLVF